MSQKTALDSEQVRRELIEAAKAYGEAKIRFDLLKNLYPMEWCKMDSAIPL